nr:hypothetical protein [Brevundimonas subvibrioides]
MIVPLIFAVALAQAIAPAENLCRVAEGRLEVGSLVTVEGRFVSDFMHFNGLVREDGSCQTAWSLAPHVDQTPLGQSFAEATWKRRPFPNTFDTAFDVTVSGEVRRDDDGRYFIWVTELEALSIDGEAVR